MKKRSQPEIMIEFMKNMSEASGVSSQMLIAWRDPRWSLIRDTLSNIKTYCINETIKKEAFK